LLQLIAVILFVLAAFGVVFDRVEILPLGLAFGFASFLTP
jgi:hypothetical protein